MVDSLMWVKGEYLLHCPYSGVWICIFMYSSFSRRIRGNLLVLAGVFIVI